MAKHLASEKILWLSDVEEHDYPAADSYLRIIYNDKKVADMVARLRTAAIVEFKSRIFSGHRNYPCSASVIRT
jgi:hypothetical protein